MVRLTVQQAVSDHAAGMVVLSLAVFTLLYGALAVVWFWLMRRYVVEGPQEHDSEPAPPAPPQSDDVAPLSFAY
jgi:cytochrome d ubiquinol oxidase subunit I